MGGKEMTIEQANKHKKIIKWWLDNTEKGLWHNIGTKEEPDWVLIYAPLFNIDYTYVQND